VVLASLGTAESGLPFESRREECLGRELRQWTDREIKLGSFKPRPQVSIWLRRRKNAVEGNESVIEVRGEKVTRRKSRGGMGGRVKPANGPK
jgi:hypothetical protein